jgi:WD repeat-containing protein 17
VYEITDHKGLSISLDKILSDHTSTITAIEWNPKDEMQLATAAEAGDVYIWSIRSERPKIHVELDTTVATMLHWNPVNTNNLLFVLKSGEVKYLKINEREIEKIPTVPKQSPVVAKWHPTNGEIIFIGYANGITEFYDNTNKLVISRHKHPVGVEDLAWYRGEDYALASYSDGTMCVFEKGHTDPRNTFERQAAGIQSVLWINDKSGDFITISKTVGALKIWNVAQKTAKKMVKIASSGVSDSHISAGAGRSIFPLSIIPIQDFSNLVLIASTNGSIALFNIEKKKIIFQTEPGHSETIFDLAFKPTDKNILASCSYDGTVKLWDAPSMKMIQTINTSIKKGMIGHSTQQRAGGDNTIFGISWSPKNDDLAWIWGKGYVKIFNTKKGNLKYEIKPGAKGFRISWNQLNGKYILSSSQDGFVYVLDFDEDNQLRVCKSINHNKVATFGVSWNNFHSNIFATGCDDGTIRVVEMSETEKQDEVTIFDGHTERVFNIVWHPHSADILASGSNDKTIRVWNIKTGKWVVLEGHTNFVRGLVWNHEIPWFLASGSWDAQIRIWDTRIGAWITILDDHHADIYGLDAHPERPFVYASCSRDNSIRFWNSEGLITNFKIQSILRYSGEWLIDQPDESMILSQNNDDSVENRVYQHTKMWGQVSKKIFENVDYGSKYTDLEQMMEIFDFFSLLDGQNEFWDMLKVIIKEAPGSLHHRVLHISDISSAVESHAIELTRSKSLKIRGNFGKKEDRKRKGAELFLKLGNNKEFWEIMMQLGEFDRALAYAPAVSLDYWKSWMEKYGDWLSRHEERFTEAPLPYISINQVDTAINLLTQAEEFEDAKLVRALKIAGVYKDVLSRYEEEKDFDDEISHHVALKNKSDLNKDEQLIMLTKRQAEQYFKAGQAILSACSYLSINDYKSALVQLMRANELFLAYVLTYFLYPEGLKDVIIRLALRAERNMLIEEAKQLYNMLEEEGAYYKSFMLLRMRMQGLYSSEGIEEEKSNSAAMEHWSYEARQIVSNLLSRKFNEAWEIWISYFEDVLENEDFQKFDKWLEMFEALQQVQLSKINSENRDKVYSYLSIIGIWKAIFHGFITILPGLFNCFVKSQKAVPHMKDFMESIEKGIYCNDSGVEKAQLHTIQLLFEDEYNTRFYKGMMDALEKYERSKTKLFDTPGDHSFLVSGSNLPSKILRSKKKTSLVSDQYIRGYPFVLENGQTFINNNEALEWAVVFGYSPLMNGNILNPF